MIRSSVPTKHISRIFFISVTSGQVIFCDLPITYKSMGKKSNPLYLLWRKLILVESYRIGQLLTIQVEICIAYPSKCHLRSPEDLGHQPSFANNFRSERVRDVGLVSVRSSRPGESTDMQYDPYRSPRDLDLSSNFDLNLSRSFYMWFDTPYRGKHDGIRIVALPLTLAGAGHFASFHGTRGGGGGTTPVPFRP